MCHFMGGGPASGKSVFSERDPALETNVAKIDPDKAKEALPEMARRGGAPFVHEESSYMSKVAVGEAYAAGVDTMVDGCGNSSPDKMRGKIQQARDAGYTVSGKYVTCPVETAIERSDGRAKKPPYRYVPHATLMDSHEAVSLIVPEIMDDFDEFELWDSRFGKGKEKLVVRKTTGGEVEILDDDLWQDFLAKGTDPLTIDPTTGKPPTDEIPDGFASKKSTTERLHSDEAFSMLAEYSNGVTKEESRFATASEVNGDYWDRMAREVDEIRAAGGDIEVPSETP